MQPNMVSRFSTKLLLSETFLAVNSLADDMQKSPWASMRGNRGMALSSCHSKGESKARSARASRIMTHKPQVELIVFFIAEYLLTPIATGNDMMEGTGKMYTWFSGHI